MEAMESLRDSYLSLTQGRIDYVKFNRIAMVHHSNAIEGSTLTELETRVLLSEGLTPKGKPAEHTLMAIDHHHALEQILGWAEQKEVLILAHLKEIAAAVLKNTGSEIHTALGTFDSSKGDLRLLNVHAGNSSFPNYDKIPRLLDDLVSHIATALPQVKGFKAVHDLAFEAHYQLVSIHPWADGNGRTSRLLMNYIQHFHGEPLSVVHLEDKAAYFNALEKTRSTKNPKVFSTFMYSQLEKHLKSEIKKLDRPFKKGKGESGISLVF